MVQHTDRRGRACTAPVLWLHVAPTMRGHAGARSRTRGVCCCLAPAHVPACAQRTACHHQVSGSLARRTPAGSRHSPQLGPTPGLTATRQRLHHAMPETRRAVPGFPSAAPCHSLSQRHWCPRVWSVPCTRSPACRGSRAWQVPSSVARGAHAASLVRQPQVVAPRRAVPPGVPVTTASGSDR